MAVVTMNSSPSEAVTDNRVPLEMSVRELTSVPLEACLMERGENEY